MAVGMIGLAARTCTLAAPPSRHVAPLEVSGEGAAEPTRRGERPPTSHPGAARPCAPNQPLLLCLLLAAGAAVHALDCPPGLTGETCATCESGR